MYPDRELTRLAAYKTALRWDIARRRTQCAEAAARVAKPLEWLDRMLAFWRRLSPLVKFTALPLGFLLKRSLAPRVRVLGALLRWGPPVLAAVRSLTGARDRSDHG
jgi:hypothetical protein